MKVKMLRGEKNFETMFSARKEIVKYLKSHKGFMVNLEWDQPVDNYSGETERKLKTFYKSDFEDNARFEKVLFFVIETRAHTATMWSVDNEIKKLDKLNKKLDKVLEREGIA